MADMQDLMNMLFQRECYRRSWFVVSKKDVTVDEVKKILTDNIDCRPYLHIYKMYCEGLTIEQIADECGIAPTSVKNSIRQGCYRLMQTLNRNYKISKIKEENRNERIKGKGN